MFTIIGVALLLFIFIYVFAKWTEMFIWMGSDQKLKIAEFFRSLCPGHKKTEDLKQAFSGLMSDYEKRTDEYAALYHHIHDIDGLEAQVADLKQVLEWTRTHLNDAKQECLEQMGQAHDARERLKVSEDLRRDQNRMLRQRFTLIRELEEHVAERDGVIDNLRLLVNLKNKAEKEQRPTVKFTRRNVLDKRK